MCINDGCEVTCILVLCNNLLLQCQTTAEGSLLVVAANYCALQGILAHTNMGDDAIAILDTGTYILQRLSYAYGLWMEVDALLDENLCVYIDGIVAGYDCFVIHRHIFSYCLQRNVYFPP